MSLLVCNPQPVLADRLSFVLERKLDAENDLKADYRAVLEFRTGEVVGESL